MVEDTSLRDLNHYTKNKHLFLFCEREIDEIFNEIDSNTDGILDRAEITRFLGKIYEPSRFADMEEILNAFGCREQGYITRDEFNAYMSSKYSMYKTSFDRYDINGDGFITLEEAEKVMEEVFAGADPNVMEIADHVIKLLHRKDDGSISLKEFIRFFVLYPHKHMLQQFHFLGTLAFNETVGVDTDDLNESEIINPVWVTLLAGTAAGVISRTITAPLDRVKTLWQANIGAEFRSIVGTFRKIVREDGFKALWRGNGTNCVKVAPQTCIRFTSYDIAKAYICADQSEPTFSERLICGGLAGLTSQTLIYPLEPVKTRLAICPTGTYKGMFDCILKIRKYEGTKALFKGICPALLGIVPYSAMDLCLFNFTKDMYTIQHDSEPPALVLLGCGSFSGLVAQTLTYPLNVIRTRLQAQGMPGTLASKALPQYTGMIDCAITTVKNESIRGLFKGIVPNYFKAIPAGAIGFVTFEKTKSFIKRNFL